MRRKLAAVVTGSGLVAAGLALGGCERGLLITNSGDRPMEMSTTDPRSGDRYVVTLQPGETRAFGGGPLDLGSLQVRAR